VDLQNSFTAGKTGKFPTKPIIGYPPHLKYVTALPWKIKNQKFAILMHVNTFQLWFFIIYPTDICQISWK